MGKGRRILNVIYTAIRGTISTYNITNVLSCVFSFAAGMGIICYGRICTVAHNCNFMSRTTQLRHSAFTTEICHFICINYFPSVSCSLRAAVRVSATNFERYDFIAIIIQNFSAISCAIKGRFTIA